MPRSEAARFLRLCERRGDIVWHRGKRGRKSSTIPATIPATIPGVVTIVHYCDFIGHRDSDATIPDTKHEPILETLLDIEEDIEIKEKKKRRRGESEGGNKTSDSHVSLSSRSQKTKEEQIKDIRAKLAAYQEQYPHINVEMELEDMLDWILSKAVVAKDYKARFRRWLRQAEKWRLERQQPPPDDWERGL